MNQICVYTFEDAFLEEKIKIMKSIYVMLMLAMVCLGATMSIDETMIHGTVKDATGEELIGVNILVKGTTIGTVTDFDGKFRLKVSALPVELEISYTGFATQIIIVDNKAVAEKGIDIVLNEGIILEETIVVSASRTKSRAHHAVSKMSTISTRKSKSSERKKAKRTPAAPIAASIRDAASHDLNPFRGTKVEDASSDIVFEPTVTDALSGKVAGVMATDGMSIGYIEEPSLVFEPETYEEQIIVNTLHFKTDASTQLLDGKFFSKNLIPLAEMNPLEVIQVEIKLKEERIKKRTEKKDPKAGQLTAGEWNDLNNWKEWEDLKKDEEFKIAKDDWQMNMFNRYSFLLENEKGQPLADAVVELLNEQNVVVWKTRTDNVGKAELYANVFDEIEENGKYQIKGNCNGKSFSIKKAKPYTEKGLAKDKINQLKITAGCNVADQLDIMMVVDATGSMRDEIAYLKSELKDVIGRVQNTDDDLYIRLGSVFYRDHGDAYLTRQTPLSDEIDQTINFINEQNAGGGGDTPEAVDVALMEAIEKQDWSKEAVARIVFLVLDASPHKQEENLKSLEKTILQAAAKGIKIIPITASGIRKETEYLMKFMATATNGTYVFITDDSGIGNTHLKPTASKYDIELLNDLMVRLIKEYTDRTKCNERKHDVMTFQNNPSNQSSTVTFPRDNKLLSKVKYFPNPAISNITIQLQDDFSSITIINSNGQEVLRLENVEVGQRDIDVSNLSEGFYLIRFKKDKTVASGKLVIIRP